VGLRERERDWQRERLFPAWDRTGGPSRAAAWSYRHPALAIAGLMVPLAALVAGFAVFGDGEISLPRLLLAFTFIAIVELLTRRKLHEEWQRQRSTDPAGGSDVERVSFWERADAHQQAAAEAENADPEGPIGSPVLERVIGLWVA
jgi:predicted lipid-binding transport protein (Tim44 family)